MPYINKDLRNKVDYQIIDLVNKIRMHGGVNNEGLLNYTITKILLATEGELSYTSINKNLGILEAVKQEYYRRRAADYEQEKIKQNGDLGEYR